MSKKHSSEVPNKGGAEVIPLNLVVDPIEIQPVATVTLRPVVVGGPIMREGFITETGALVTAMRHAPINLVVS